MIRLKGILLLFNLPFLQVLDLITELHSQVSLSYLFICISMCVCVYICAEARRGHNSPPIPLEQNVSLSLELASSVA